MQGTWDDLKLFVVINAVILLVLALARTWIGDHDLWHNMCGHQAHYYSSTPVLLLAIQVRSITFQNSCRYSTYKLIFGEFDDADVFSLQVC